VERYFHVNRLRAALTPHDSVGAMEVTRRPRAELLNLVGAALCLLGANPARHDLAIRVSSILWPGIRARPLKYRKMPIGRCALVGGHFQFLLTCDSLAA